VGCSVTSALLATLCALFLAAPSQAGAVTCGGKQATIVGTRGHDVIGGSRGSDVIYGAGGNDRITGGRAGNDTICGGRGVDRLFGAAGNDRLYGGRGSDRALGGGHGADRIFGGRGNDTARGGSAADYLDGGLGDDRLKGADGGGDVVIGNHGSDRARGGRGEGDVVRGELGHDKLDGGPGGGDIVSFAGASESVTVNLFRGFARGDGRDSLRRFEDVVNSPFTDTAANDGPAVIRGRAIDGSTTLAVYGSVAGESVGISFDRTGYLVSGEAGHPPANVEGCTPAGDSRSLHCLGEVDMVTVSVGDGADVVRIAPNLPAHVQVRIDGGPGPDALYGGSGDEVIEAGDDADADLLSGGDGDDALIGARTDAHVPIGSGRSTMLGGAGSDVLVGGDPCDGDLYDGGSGNDNANFFRFTPGVVAEIGGTATRAGESCTPGRVLSSIEALEGSPGADVLSGNGGDNTLTGGGGNDMLSGAGGDDRLVGGSGGDRLLGGSGLDSTHQ
jgi:Ca2+-binding RTX toxin-like protein